MSVNSEYPACAEEKAHEAKLIIIDYDRILQNLHTFSSTAEISYKVFKVKWKGYCGSADLPQGKYARSTKSRSGAQKHCRVGWFKALRVRSSAAIDLDRKLFDTHCNIAAQELLQSMITACKDSENNWSPKKISVFGAVVKYIMKKAERIEIGVNIKGSSFTPFISLHDRADYSLDIPLRTVSNTIYLNSIPNNIHRFQVRSIPEEQCQEDGKYDVWVDFKAYAISNLRQQTATDLENVSFDDWNSERGAAVIAVFLSFVADITYGLETGKALLDLCLGKDSITEEKENRIILGIYAAASLLPVGKVIVKGTMKSTLKDLLNPHAIHANHNWPKNIFKIDIFSLLIQLSKNPKNLASGVLTEAAEKAGIQKFRKQYQKGQQLWVTMRKGKIQSGGINLKGDPEAEMKVHV